MDGFVTFFLAAGLFAMLVGVEDVLDKVVAKHIGCRKFNLGDSLDAAQYGHGVFQSGFLARSQVHLGGVSGDDGLAVGAKPGQEHLHLGQIYR